jgi:predicted phosphodiesterase
MLELDSLRIGRQLVDKVGIKVTVDDEGIPTIETHKTNQIRTLPQLMKAAEIDTDVYEVVPGSFKANCWNVFSNKNGNVPLWQVCAKFRQRFLSQEDTRKLVKRACEAFAKALKWPLPKVKPCKNGRMVCLGVPDLHLGKLAWNPETHAGSWDCKIAQQVWEEAIDDLLARAPEAEECWLPLGNDFFNVDNDQRTTTSGTPQDEDGRWQKTFRMGVEMTQWAIGRCLKKYPYVKVIMVYGNHDRQRSFYLGELLAEMAKNIKNLEVDNEPTDRKYFKWGETGIGFAHGDRLKEKDLAALCQNEARDIWGQTKRFELICGHIHNPIVKTLGGVLVRWLSALCPPDLWHYKAGYTMAEKSATVLVYNQRNMENQLMHYPDPKNFL